MNKIIIIFLLILIVLGFLNDIIEYFRSKTTSIRRFENDSFRHFKHISIPLVSVLGAVWIIMKMSNDFHIAINIILGLISLIFIILALISFYLYSNYMLKNNVDFLLYNKEAGVIEINGQPVKKALISHVNWYKARNKSLLIFWNNFEYAEIIMKDGEKHIITSLLLNLKILHKYFHRNAVSYFFLLIPRIK
ncbi:MAG: hypothetical protein M3421_15995 [Bacteroidota bacterium]|jgi:membrane-associated HD superfamily phosphohydrolase|nr:hypothetical protein [Bacteroidota bacterium]